jgi:hypothetical protein
VKSLLLFFWFCIRSQFGIQKEKSKLGGSFFSKRDENGGLVINAIWRTTKLTRNRVPWLVKQLSCLTNTWRDLGTASVRSPSLPRQSVRLAVSVGGHHSLCCCHYSCKKYWTSLSSFLSLVLLFKLTHFAHPFGILLLLCACESIVLA